VKPGDLVRVSDVVLNDIVVHQDDIPSNRMGIIESISPERYDDIFRIMFPGTGATLRFHRSHITVISHADEEWKE